jgi:malonate transporter
VNFALLLFPDFCLILCGYLLCHHTPLNRQVWEPVERLVYYFLFPVLLFHSIVRSPIDLAATSQLILAALALGALSVSLTYAIPHLPGLRRWIDPQLHAASAQVGFRFNSFIALVLAEKLGGGQYALLIAVLIGVCVPPFNVAAVWPMARHGQRGFWRELARNPLIIATGSGLVANLLGLQIPDWLDPTLRRIGASSLALGLMTAGAGMVISNLTQAKALAAAVLTVRHLLTPLLAWWVAGLFELDKTQTLVLLSFSALPTASSAYVLASRMGYNGAYVAGLVTLSTVLGMLSIPFAIQVLGAGFVA